MPNGITVVSYLPLTILGTDLVVSMATSDVFVATSAALVALNMTPAELLMGVVLGMLCDPSDITMASKASMASTLAVNRVAGDVDMCYVRHSNYESFL